MVRCPEIPEDMDIATNAVVLGDEDVNKDFTGQTPEGTKYTDIRRALETPHLTYEETSIHEGDVSRNFETSQNKI